MAGNPTPGNPTISPVTEGEKGTCHTDIMVETREGWGEQPRKYTRQQNVDNRRLLTTLGYRHR